MRPQVLLPAQSASPNPARKISISSVSMYLLLVCSKATLLHNVFRHVGHSHRPHCVEKKDWMFPNWYDTELTVFSNDAYPDVSFHTRVTTLGLLLAMCSSVTRSGFLRSCPSLLWNRRKPFCFFNEVQDSLVGASVSVWLSVVCSN